MEILITLEGEDAERMQRVCARQGCTPEQRVSRIVKLDLGVTESNEKAHGVDCDPDKNKK